MEEGGYRGPSFCAEPGALRAKTIKKERLPVTVGLERLFKVFGVGFSYFVFRERNLSLLIIL